MTHSEDSSLTDPAVRNYRSGFLKRDSLSLPKSYRASSAILSMAVHIVFSRVLSLAMSPFNRYVRLFPPSLQWVPWPPLAGALRFPTFVGTMGS
jgi:hypothetical protein